MPKTISQLATSTGNCESIVIWLIECDRNLKFFHQMLAYRRSKSCISSLVFLDGKESRNKEETLLEVVNYFRHILSSKEVVIPEAFFSSLPKLVTDSNNEKLLAPSSENELREAVCSIPIDSTPGPIGFFVAFYQSCWFVAAQDLLMAANEFFVALLGDYYKVSFITLISSF